MIESSQDKPLNPFAHVSESQIGEIMVGLIPRGKPVSLVPSREEVEARLGIAPHRWYMARPEELILAVVALYEEKRGQDLE